MDRYMKRVSGENNNRKVISLVTSKTRTAFIFCLAQFEENFGFMWGLGEKEENLTDEQKENKKFWTEVREKILDNGNNQIRAIERILGE